MSGFAVSLYHLQAEKQNQQNLSLPIHVIVEHK